MQTSKSKASPIEVTSRSSPKTLKIARQNKPPGSSSEQVLSSPNKDNRAKREHSPKVSERRTPQSPISEKKRETKASDLESNIVQLQVELKLARDKMVSSELLKEQAELEAEDAKKLLSDMTTKFEEMEKQLIEISSKDKSEKSPLQELCKMSQDGDKMLESELEAVHKLQNSQDSADQVNLGGSACDEFCNLRIEHEKAVAMVQKLEAALGECKKSEAQMLEELNKTRSELEAAKEENNTLKLHKSHDAIEHINSSMASELEESKTKVNELEMLVAKLQSNLASGSDGIVSMNELSAVDSRHCQENGQNEEMEKLKSEIMNLKYEDCKLRAALEAAEKRYQEAKLQTTSDIRSAYEQAESSKSILRSKEAELQKANSVIAELQAKLADCETRLRINDAEMDQKSELEIRVTELQDTLSKKDMLVQEIEKENKSLKQRLTEMVDGSAADNLVEARAAEQKAISKFEYLTEESDKNSKRTARVIEQLNAAQSANTELESELRKLKVQSDQWRKAAEAAAAMLTSGNNGKYIDRTGSLDSGYHHTLGGRIGSPFSDDLNDEAVKKKNGNMLKKIGVLWKKGQNQK